MPVFFMRGRPSQYFSPTCLALPLYYFLIIGIIKLPPFSPKGKAAEEAFGWGDVA